MSATIERVRGGYLVADMIDGHRVSERYCGYTKREALRVFRNTFAPLPERNTYATWADGFGVWHCRVTFPSHGYGNAGEYALDRHWDSIRASARRAIRREILAREHATGDSEAPHTAARESGVHAHHGRYCALGGMVHARVHFNSVEPHPLTPHTHLLFNSLFVTGVIGRT